MSETAPTQAEVDAAVAREVARNPFILVGSVETPHVGLPVPAADEPPTSDAQSTAAIDQPTVTALPQRVRVALERRRTFLSAMTALRARGHTDPETLRAALADADREQLVGAIVRHAVGEFLDRECQRDGTLLHELSSGIEQDLVNAIYAEAAGILAVPPDGTPETAYIRRHALAATTLDQHVFDVQGQPTRPRPPTLSTLQTLVPRS